MSERDVLDFYRRQSDHSSPGHHSAAFRALSTDVAELCRTVQGLLIYDETAEPFYGFTPPKDRLGEIHLQTANDRLAAIHALDTASLIVPRPPERRLLSRCDGYVLLLTSILRSKGVPARARCGFGSYFNPGRYEDHWTCEWWDEHNHRWRLTDPQFDEVWRTRMHIRHDITDVPRDAFLVAADAWSACRSGRLDSDLFGISFARLKGLWYIAGNLVRDLAALNLKEMRPWDVWGVQPAPDSTLDAKQLAFFDNLAELTALPDAHLEELRTLYAQPGLEVPSKIINALTQKQEAA